MNNYGWGNGGPGPVQGPQSQNGSQPGMNSWVKPQMMFLPGKCVNTFEEILPSDVPMDGNPAVFLKNDGSTVWVKVWSSNGQIVPYEYKLVPQNGSGSQTQTSSSVDEEFKAAIFKRFDEMEQSIKRLNKPYKPHYNKNREVKKNDAE